MPETALHRLAYTSRAVPPLPDTELQRILDVARHRNKALQVTGALVFTGEYFVQVLEGADGPLSELYACISRDPRHTDVRLSDRLCIPRRSFSEWSMGYLHGSEFASELGALMKRPALPMGWILTRLREELISHPTP